VHESQKEHTQLESLKEDLVSAKEIQQSFLPEVTDVPGVTDVLDLAASMEAAKDVGGDFYDFFRIDEDRIALVIADVCGKGIPAALFMAVSRTIIHSKGMQGVSAAECLTESNLLLANSSVNHMYVTVFYAIFNTKTGLVTYCNAGHNSPHILRANGTVEQLPMDGYFMVGAFEDEKYTDRTLQLEHGDTLVMFTDGVTEAMNPECEMFGKERLDGILRSQESGVRSQEIVEAIKAGIVEFVEDAEQSDDITMLVVKRL
jgi:sigma-B regulation protein RsbU (phosphoserine phosphatase)